MFRFFTSFPPSNGFYLNGKCVPQSHRGYEVGCNQGTQILQDMWGQRPVHPDKDPLRSLVVLPCRQPEYGEEVSRLEKKHETHLWIQDQIFEWNIIWSMLKPCTFSCVGICFFLPRYIAQATANFTMSWEDFHKITHLGWLSALPLAGQIGFGDNSKSMVKHSINRCLKTLTQHQAGLHRVRYLCIPLYQQC